MKALAVSDVEVGIIYSTAIRERFKDARLAVSCGDLPLDYLEYIMSSLDIPMYFVFGNHAHTINNREKDYEPGPWGAINLNGRVYRDETGLLLAGVEGCLQYNYGPHQYSQWEMWGKVFSLIPKLVYNRLRYGRFLDVFITHAPPWKIHDQPDLPTFTFITTKPRGIHWSKEPASSMFSGTKKSKYRRFKTIGAVRRNEQPTIRPAAPGDDPQGSPC
jgi:hypothetical protein